MITHEVTVWCDEDDCQVWEQSSDPLPMLRKELRYRGWASSPHGDYCPFHARQRGIKPVKQRNPTPHVSIYDLPLNPRVSSAT